MTTPSQLSPVYAVECGPEGCGVYVPDRTFVASEFTIEKPWTTYDEATAARLAVSWDRLGRPCRVVTIELSVRKTTAPRAATTIPLCVGCGHLTGLTGSDNGFCVHCSLLHENEHGN